MSNRRELAPPPTLTTPLQVDIPTLAPGELERLSARYATTRDPALRDALVLQHQRLVRSIVTRFLGSGETLEDLIQVGNIGLINALDRYNPEQGTRFSTYATPTIMGEIKRHFRDKTSSIKMPRWLQERQQATRRATQELIQTLGRAPSIGEIALHIGVDEDAIVEAMESGEVTNVISLDASLDSGTSADSSSLLDVVGQLDKTLNEFETFSDLRTAMEALGAREREVIALRFFEELSQAKIAQRLNISQMHVSRLQQKALTHLRELLCDESRAPLPRRHRKPKQTRSSMA